MFTKNFVKQLLIIAVALGLALTYGIWRVALGRWAPLPAGAYQQSWLLAEAAGNLWSWLFLFAGLALPLWQWRTLRWQGLGQLGPLRWYAIGLGFLLAWLLSGYGYNYYFGQAHWADRALLWLLWGLVAWHPAALAPFIWWALLLQGQFSYPLGGYSVADIRPVYEQLLLLQIYLAAHALFGWLKERWPATKPLSQAMIPFWAMALSLQAANYIGPGWGKLTLNWLGENQLANLWIASYSHGWLASLTEVNVIAIAHQIERFNTPLLIVTLVVELGMFFLVVRRRLTLGLLLTACGLHLAVLALSGIFFWKWILVNLALSAVIWRLPVKLREQLYSGPVLLAVFVLLLGSGLYFRPAQLYWYDTPLTQRYELEVVLENGVVQRLDRNFLRPYQIVFSKEPLHFLNAEPILVGSYGATVDRELLVTLDAVKGIDELSKIGLEFGSFETNPAGQSLFDEFIRAYFLRYSQQTGFSGWRYPDHILTEFPVNGYVGEPDIAQLQVRYIQTWYDGAAIQIVEDEIIRVVELGSGD